MTPDSTYFITNVLIKMIGAQSGRLRWAVDVAQWSPSQSEFDFLCSLLPDEDASECRKFKFLEDQKRALVSRLLQRHAAATILGIPHKDVVIKRTRGKKPYVANDLLKPHAPNFNYSVSHEGHYVALAAEGTCLCGCDIAAPNQLRRNTKTQQSIVELLSSFKGQLTPSEWHLVHNAGPDDHAIESKFRQLWSLKEAYVKATGEGLGFDLGKTEFTLSSNTTATVAVQGIPQPQWIFHLHELGNPGHWISVARGPLQAIVDAWGGFTATLQNRNYPMEQHKSILSDQEPVFDMLGVCDLLPSNARGRYEAAGGEII